MSTSDKHLEDLVDPQAEPLSLEKLDQAIEAVGGEESVEQPPEPSSNPAPQEPAARPTSDQPHHIRAHGRKETLNALLLIQKTAGHALALGLLEKSEADTVLGIEASARAVVASLTSRS